MPTSKKNRSSSSVSNFFNQNKVLFLAVIALLVLISFNKQVQQDKALRMSAESEQEQKNEMDLEKATAYKLSITDAHDESQYVTLQDAIANAVSQKPETIRLFHDDTLTPANTTNSYHLLTDADISKLEGSAFMGITINSVETEPELKPYLISRKYCQVDADCSSTENFCSIGSFNQYHPVATFGCGAVTSVEGYSDEELIEASKNCPINDNTGSPGFFATVGSAKCVTNVCEAQDIQIKCSN